MRTPVKQRKAPKLKNTTIRDFGGGWNISDSEQNLTSRFAPVFDNMIVHSDRSVSPRYGFETWLKLKNGAEDEGTADDVIFSTTNTSRVVNLEWTAHPFDVGGDEEEIQHVTISGLLTDLFGIPKEELNATHGVVVVDADNITIVVRTAATSTNTSTRDISYVRDEHALGGVVVDARYFSNYLIVFSSIGEILAIDSERTVTRIWSHFIANGYAGNPDPWGPTEIVAMDVFSKELIASNGVDKPVRIDFTDARIVDYQVDPGEGFTNTYIPPFDACKSAFRYFNVHDTGVDRETEVRITARNTSVVYSDAPTDPGDAVDVDVSKILASSELTVRAFAVIKNTLMVLMPNSSVLLELGTYDEALHEPTPVDTLPGFGTSAMRSVVEVASDVFMIDYNGVPSAKLSALSNAVVPERVSQLIEPHMAAHIGRLSKETVRLKAFGFYDGKNRCVHFYLPKYDDNDVRSLYVDPFSLDEDMAGGMFLLMRISDHQFEVGDQVIIAGATGFSGISAGDINGTRTIVGVLDHDHVYVSVAATLPEDVAGIGGGSSVTIQPINDESIGYIYHYQPAAKINAWSRFKGMKFNAGCATLEGRAFLFSDDMVFRYGSPDEPVYGDRFGEFDYSTWVSGTSYAVDDRVRDVADGRVYQVIAAHTSIAGSFQEARDDAPDNWEEYIGDSVEFSWELPWADFGARQLMKGLQRIHVDATGDQQFTVDAFIDNQYSNAESGVPVPARSITFVPNDAGNYGTEHQVYGGGRRTREQLVWTYPARFKLLKIRARGSALRKLRFNAYSFLYLPGGYVRG